MKYLWTGLSYKNNKNGEKMTAFDVTSKSGSLIHEITSDIKYADHSYENIVDHIPIDDNGKECLPSIHDFEKSWDIFWNKVEYARPNLILIFGAGGAKFCKKKLKITGEKYQIIPYKNISLIFCDHPSYISVYKRKETGNYKATIKKLCLSYSEVL